MKKDVTVTLGKTPEEVFPYLTDIEKIQQWSPVKNLTLQTDGPVGVGTQFSQVASILGQNIKFDTEVTVYDPPTSYAFKTISGPMNFEQRFTLTPTAGGSQLEAVLEGEPGGVFKLAGPLVEPTIHKQLQDQLNKLKQLLEQ